MSNTAAAKAIYNLGVTAQAAIDQTLQSVLPLTAGTNTAGHLTVGGVDTVELAREFGTPLYAFDEADLRARCQEFRTEFESRWRETTVLYAGKAYLGKAIARIVAQEGLGLDVVSGGEIAIAQAAGFPLERAYFHGNNKLREEMEEAVAAGVGRVVVDNFTDIRLLPKPVGRIPIWVGGGSEPAYRRAVRTGEGFQLIGVTPEEAAPVVARLRSERPEPEFTISLRTGWDPLGMDRNRIVEERAAYSEAGVQHIVAAPWRRDLAEWREAMEVLAGLVI